MKTTVWEIICVVLAIGAHAFAGEADPDTEVARRHFQKGTVYYSQDEYPAALQEFEAARRVKPLPAFDYNIGRCLDRMERYRDAIAAYERYVNAPGHHADEAQVRERIQILRERVAQGEAAKPTARPETPPALAVQVVAPPPKPLTRRAWFWGAVGAGVVVVAAAITVGVVVGTSDSEKTLPGLNFSNALGVR